jgi:hypothetical protein
MKKEQPLTDVERVSNLIVNHFGSMSLEYSEAINGMTVKVAWGSAPAPLKVPNPYLGKWILTSVVRTDVDLDNFELTYQLYRPDSYCVAFNDGTKIPNTRSFNWDELTKGVAGLNEAAHSCGLFPSGLHFIVVPDPNK